MRLILLFIVALSTLDLLAQTSGDEVPIGGGALIALAAAGGAALYAKAKKK